MGKSKTTAKHRLDRFYHLAKEQGYRSRAAFKLIQLDSKFCFLSSARSLLDLCAAPGGWMQVAYKHMPVGSLVVGVDLVPIRPVRGALTLQEDITAPKCKVAIRKLLKERGHTMVDVVLHDGSPNVGGAWAKEATSQAALVLDSLKLAVQFLAPKGTYVTKVFRSQDYNSLLYAFKQLFDKVEVTKPVASRSTSAEIYVICLRYRAPAKIDPRLLDVKHLFQEIVEPPKVVDVLRGTKQKRNREGYEEGNTTLRKECLASDFIWSSTPLELLGSITSISFEDPACFPIQNHPLTTDEVKILCEDLRVLSKQEFKQILKWRLYIRKNLSPATLSSLPAGKDAEVVSPSDEDEGILNEMQELKEMMEVKKKRAKKLLAKRHAKTKARTAMGMQIDVTGDGYEETNLFSLSTIKGKRDLQAIESASDGDDDDGDSANEVEYIVDEKSNSETDDQGTYDAELEQYFDKAYARYRSATDGSTKRRKRAKLTAIGNESELWQENRISGNLGGQQEGETSDCPDVEADEANPLVVPIAVEVKPSSEQLTEQWFSQDVFAGIEDKSDDIDLLKKAPKVSKSGIETLASVYTRGDEIMKVSTKCGTDEGFEVVAAESSGLDDSSDEDYDSDTKAEILAYAKKMLRKKDRDAIIDSAYNRYTFNDEGLPDWFVDDEKMHCQPIKPVSKADIQAMKGQFNGIDVRPVKKVAEAKARKKRRALKRLESIKQKANAIADQPDVSTFSKRKMMERLYKKAATPRKPRKELLVAKKGMSGKLQKGKILVDHRMKKDQRVHGMNKPGKKGKRVTIKKGNIRKGAMKGGGHQRK